MLTGTSVQKGQGRYMVTSVGVNTESGRVRALVLGLKMRDTVQSSGGATEHVKQQIETEDEDTFFEGIFIP